LEGCNENGIPDDWDIATGASQDRFGNGIPDECEADCDADGVSDYTQIQSEMSLDVNRNTVLDSCEDCDGDGVVDRIELAGAHNVWVASLKENALREFHAVTGVLMTVSEVELYSDAQDVLIDQAGRIFVSSGTDDRVVEFDRFGAYVRDFVSAGAGGLDFPSGMVFKSDGNMLVGSGLGHSVLEFDGADGGFIGVFVASRDGGLEKPFGMAIGPNGNLFVTSEEDQVLEYDGTTGAFIGVFVSAADNGGLSEARGMAFKPDGNLLVCSQRTDQVLEYDARSGAFLRQFNNGGTDVALTLDDPWGIRIGPDGVVYVSRSGVQEAESPPFLQDPQLHVNSSRLYAFDATTGIFLRSYVLGNDTGLWQPSAFDFFPGAGIDCNLNNIPDACDIASGSSLDKNGDGVPDECACPGDLDGDGQVGLTDLLSILAAWGPCVNCPEDLNGDDNVGFTDMVQVLASWGPCVSIR
jgi:outer membrane protein assembly factor BamB